MRNSKIFVSLIAMGTIASVPSAFAKSKLMKACKKDLKKFGCMAKTDDTAFECLEKHEKEGQKNDGFTRSCYKAHESYEKKMGKEEKGEAHEHGETGEGY